MNSRSWIFACLAGLLCAANAAAGDAFANETSRSPNASAAKPDAAIPGSGPRQSAKPKDVPTSRPPAEIVRRQMLADLFARLSSAADPTEARSIALAIQHVWFETRSDTAKLLMQRALQSIRDNHYPLALLLLDKIVALEPGWAEAWNQRATTRFLADDAEGAMADIDQVMKLEPRHFGALAGMGAILQRAGLEKQALQVYTRSLSLFPMQPELQKIVDKLRLAVEGRDI